MDRTDTKRKETREVHHATGRESLPANIKKEPLMQFTMTIEQGNPPEVGQVFTNEINGLDYKVIKVKGKRITFEQIKEQKSG